MIRFAVLASGSKANATVVEAFGFRILIDCGLSLRELSKRLGVIGLEVKDLDALLITHFHSDHIKGAAALLDKQPLEVYAAKGFHHIASKAKAQILKPLIEFQLGSFNIVAMPLPHDDGGSFGFVISSDDQNFVFATDLGYATEDLCFALKTADATIIESNHDLEMLQACAYPHFIKERIRSAYGHLSNCQSSHLLQTSLSSRCQQVVLAHLSERANHPFQALAQMRRTIITSVNVASQYEPSAWYSIAVANSELPICANA